MFDFGFLRTYIHGLDDLMNTAIDVIVAHDEAERWLRMMAQIGVRDIRVYTTAQCPYSKMADLVELDGCLADRRHLEFNTLGYCQDMHPHYAAAFLFVQTGHTSGMRYTLTDYGRRMMFEHTSPIGRALELALIQKFKASGVL
jgi:hypothetical protein